MRYIYINIYTYTFCVYYVFKVNINPFRMCSCIPSALLSYCGSINTWRLTFFTIASIALYHECRFLKILNILQICIYVINILNLYIYIYCDKGKLENTVKNKHWGNNNTLIANILFKTISSNSKTATFLMEMKTWEVELNCQTSMSSIWKSACG